jgi:hypothetical protein
MTDQLDRLRKALADRPSGNWVAVGWPWCISRRDSGHHCQVVTAVHGPSRITHRLACLRLTDNNDADLAGGHHEPQFSSRQRRCQAAEG